MEENKMKNIKDNQFANFIIEIRSKRNLTQKQLADIINVSDRTISKWENGQTVPDLVNIKNICEELNVSPNSVILNHKTFKDKMWIIKQRIKIILDYLFKNIFAIGFIITFLILFTYFVNNFNSVNIYTLQYSSENINIEHGYLLKSKGQNVLFVDNITLDKIEYEISDLHIELYTYVNGDKYLIYENNNLEDIFIEELSSYPILLKPDVINAIRKNLYLDITTQDIEGKIYTYSSIINLTNRFSNNQISYETYANDDKYDISFLAYLNEKPEYSINEDIKYNYNKINSTLIYIPDNTKSKLEDLGFIYDEENDVYKKYDGKGVIYYFKDTLIIYEKIENDTKYNMKFYLDNNKIDYIVFGKTGELKMNLKYSITTNQLVCKIGDCKNYLTEVAYIISIYNEINEIL